MRLEVTDIRKLSEAAPLRVVTYQFAERDDLFTSTRRWSRLPRDKNVGNVGWTGREIVAFRLHLPSKIRDQNSGAAGSAAATFSRGNKLRSADRLRGVRSRSTRRWIRSRFSTARCGCSPRRS